MSSRPKDRTDLRVRGTAGHVGKRPVPVASNALGSIEVGAYQVTDSGFALTVVCVERADAPSLPDNDFYLGTENGPVVSLRYGRRQLLSTSPEATVSALPLKVATPFGDRGLRRSDAGDTIGRRSNGDRVVQHGIVVDGLPDAIAATRHQEARVEKLWKSFDVEDLRNGVEAASKLSPAHETIEVSVAWPAADLKADVTLDMTYTPHPDNVLNVDLGY